MLSYSIIYYRVYAVYNVFNGGYVNGGQNNPKCSCKYQYDPGRARLIQGVRGIMSPQYLRVSENVLLCILSKLCKYSSPANLATTAGRSENREGKYRVKL